MSALESKLAGWTGPSSATEQEKQDRTERMIRAAVRSHPGFANCSLRVYAKGSYANNTNVRADSDVDIAVQCTDVMYFREQSPGAKPPGTPYQGPWTPARLRTELHAALNATFPGQVDASGSTALTINSGSARVDADVVPCFDFRYYFTSGGYRDGARVFTANGEAFENYPDQQMANGIAKNNATNQRFKRAVRILKRLENAMNAAGVHREVPSYFVECLVYNVPNTVLTRSSWTEVARGVLAHVYRELDGDEPSDQRWMEVNGIKYLFHSDQRWTRLDGQEFALSGWNYLGYRSRIAA